MQPKMKMQHVNPLKWIAESKYQVKRLQDIKNLNVA